MFCRGPGRREGGGRCRGSLGASQPGCLSPPSTRRLALAPSSCKVSPAECCVTLATRSEVPVHPLPQQCCNTLWPHHRPAKRRGARLHIQGGENGLRGVRGRVTQTSPVRSQVLSLSPTRHPARGGRESQGRRPAPVPVSRTGALPRRAPSRRGRASVPSVWSPVANHTSVQSGLPDSFPLDSQPPTGLKPVWGKRLQIRPPEGQGAGGPLPPQNTEEVSRREVAMPGSHQARAQPPGIMSSMPRPLPGSTVTCPLFERQETAFPCT